jgi:hypothetical protein
MKPFKKLRSDSYEASLTTKQREQLYVWLLDPAVSQKEVCRRAPPWPSGKRAGRKPGEYSLARIGQRLRLEGAMQDLDATAAVKQAALVRMLQNAAPDVVHEETVNLAMQLISQEVIQKTLKRLDPASRTAAAKLLLERSDQGLDRAKFLLEVRKYQEATEALKEKHQAEGDQPRRLGGIPAEIMEQVEKDLRLL